MLRDRRLRLRFGLKTLFILMLGIAIGYSLNVWSLWLVMGPRLRSLPTYVIEPPDILAIEIANGSKRSPSASGQYLVGPDGRVNLRAYGTVYVAGMTIEGARKAIERQLNGHVDEPKVLVDVFAYNSKKYYVITKHPSLGDDVVEGPITGNETVLDAIARIGGLPQISSADIWIARPAPNGVGSEQVLPIDWDKISRGESLNTNYQMWPGDRLFISQKPGFAVSE